MGECYCSGSGRPFALLNLPGLWKMFPPPLSTHAIMLIRPPPLLRSESVPIPQNYFPSYYFFLKPKTELIKDLIQFVSSCFPLQNSMSSACARLGVLNSCTEYISLRTLSYPL
jgi:hypothetical protein